MHIHRYPKGRLGGQQQQQFKVGVFLFFFPFSFPFLSLSFGFSHFLFLVLVLGKLSKDLKESDLHQLEETKGRGGRREEMGDKSHLNSKSILQFFTNWVPQSDVL